MEELGFRVDTFPQALSPHSLPLSCYTIFPSIQWSIPIKWWCDWLLYNTYWTSRSHCGHFINGWFNVGSKWTIEIPLCKDFCVKWGSWWSWRSCHGMSLSRGFIFVRVEWSFEELNHFLLFFLVCSSSVVPEEVDFNMVWCCYSAAVAACLAAGLRHLLYRNISLLCCDLLVCPEFKGRKCQSNLMVTFMHFCT